MLLAPFNRHEPCRMRNEKRLIAPRDECLPVLNVAILRLQAGAGALLCDRNSRCTVTDTRFFEKVVRRLGGEPAQFHFESACWPVGRTMKCG